MEEKEEINFSKQGKKNRSSGTRFEFKVREDLEKDGWIVSKWMNNIDMEKNKMIPSKRKYNPFMKALSIGTGFPDFLAFKKTDSGFQIIGVEAKAKGYLDKDEKQKAFFYLEKNIFPKILIAKKSKSRGKIDYTDFKEKYSK